MKKAALTFLSIFGALFASAQCDSTAYYTQRYMGEDIVSDGQSYRALLFEDQVAEFTTTLYGGNTYRIAAYAGFKPEQIIFNMYDQENNLLFTNEEHRNAPYWNFSINQTITVKIEAMLDQAKQSSGCAVLLIGFKR